MVNKKKYFILIYIFFSYCIWSIDYFSVSQLHIFSSTNDEINIELKSEQVEVFDKRIKSTFVLSNLNTIDQFTVKISFTPVAWQTIGSENLIPKYLTAKLDGENIPLALEYKGKTINKEAGYQYSGEYTTPCNVIFQITLQQNEENSLELEYDNEYPPSMYIFRRMQYLFSTNLDHSKNTSFSLVFQYLSDRMAYISNIRFLHKKVNTDYHDDWHLTSILSSSQKLHTYGLKVLKQTETQFKILFSDSFFDKNESSILLLIQSFDFYARPDFEIGNKNVYYVPVFYARSSEQEEEYNGNLSKRLLNPYELITLSNEQLRLIRNAFYAAHGYQFKSKDLQDFFAPYNIPPNPNFSESLFNEVERANIETIKALENMKLPAIIEF